ncbi:PTS glucitol/sorbitol transporter subunit IIC, partial [Anaerostipes caccae]|uniref:PTS glucitol/sorbitol transporter subunit IIC n=1 Tax=Anaerostipes caccae TaxID=105841 RepID=UPI002FE6F74A
MKLFQEGGTTFMGWVTGIIPLVVCLMTADGGQAALLHLFPQTLIKSYKLTEWIFLLLIFLPAVTIKQHRPRLFLPDLSLCGQFIEQTACKISRYSKTLGEMRSINSLRLDSCPLFNLLKEPVLVCLLPSLH